MFSLVKRFPIPVTLKHFNKKDHRPLTVSFLKNAFFFVTFLEYLVVISSDVTIVVC